MRWLTLILVALIALLQYSLWFGKGSWIRAGQLEQQLKEQKVSNQMLRVRNASLDAEVRDLKQGYSAIEERARSELGMIKRDEVFFEVLEQPKPVTLKKRQPSPQKRAMHQGNPSGTPDFRRDAAPGTALR